MYSVYGLFLNSSSVGLISQDMILAVSNAREPESEEKPQKSLNEKQQVSGFWQVKHSFH